MDARGLATRGTWHDRPALVAAVDDQPGVRCPEQRGNIPGRHDQSEDERRICQLEDQQGLRDCLGPGPIRLIDWPPTNLR